MRNLMLTGLLLLGLKVGAQSNEAVATVPAKGLEIHKESIVNYAEFDLATSADFLDYMKTEAAKYANYFVFETTLQSTGVYHCKMGFTHEAVIQNFHKMFLALGINKIRVNNQVMSVNELLNLK